MVGNRFTHLSSPSKIATKSSLPSSARSLSSSPSIFKVLQLKRFEKGDGLQDQEQILPDIFVVTEMAGTGISAEAREGSMCRNLTQKLSAITSHVHWEQVKRRSNLCQKAGHLQSFKAATSEVGGSLVCPTLWRRPVWFYWASQQTF